MKLSLVVELHHEGLTLQVSILWSKSPEKFRQVDVPTPELGGESITEGTIAEWTAKAQGSWRKQELLATCSNQDQYQCICLDDHKSHEIPVSIYSDRSKDFTTKNAHRVL